MTGWLGKPEREDGERGGLSSLKESKSPLSEKGLRQRSGREE